MLALFSMLHRLNFTKKFTTSHTTCYTSLHHLKKIEQMPNGSSWNWNNGNTTQEDFEAEQSSFFLKFLITEWSSSFSWWLQLIQFCFAVKIWRVGTNICIYTFHGSSLCNQYVHYIQTYILTIKDNVCNTSRLLSFVVQTLIEDCLTVILFAEHAVILFLRFKYIFF